MPKVNNSKKVQLGPKTLEVPRKWDKVQLNSVCENLDSERIPVKKSERNSGDIPYYGATGCIGYIDGYIFDEELVLVGEDGADWSAFAPTSYIIRGKSWVNNHAHVLKCKKIEEVYLSELFNFLDLNYAIVGTNRGKFNKKDLMDLEVLYPSLLEQKKIAEILSTVDEAIQKTEEIIEQTKELKKGLMQDLLTKGIGHEEFKKVQLGPKSVEAPIDWEIRTLGNICDINMGSSPPSKYYNEEQNGLPFYQGNAEFSEIYPQPEVWCSKPEKTAKSGSVLISVRAPVGEINLSSHKCCIGRGVAALDGQEIDNRFMFYLLKGERKRLQSYAQGSTFKAINKSVLDKLPISLPPLPEQKKIAETLSTVDEKIQLEQKHKEKLEKIKKGLMQDLLTGKVRVLPLLAEEEKEAIEKADVAG